MKKHNRQFDETPIPSVRASIRTIRVSPKNNGAGRIGSDESGRKPCGTRKTAGKRRVLLPQEIGLYFKMENVVLCFQSLDRIGGKIQTKTSSPQDPPLAMYYAAT